MSKMTRRDAMMIAASAGVVMEGALSAEAAQDAREKFVVRGTTTWDQRWLQTDRLVFEPGSVLQLSRQAIQVGGGRVVILARTIQCDQANPGTIRWANPDYPPPTGLGKALPGQSFDPTGNENHSQGRTGGDGSSGLTGMTGLRGSDAPVLELWTLAVEGVGPKIDFRGQNGQAGGPGQDGGDGGNGEKGTHGESGLFDCHKGGGYGGRGGNGGNGGNGGPGGEGGKGGVIMIMAPQAILHIVADKARCLVAGGSGGRGGDPGRGGNPGGGGAGGRGDGIWCRDESGNRHAGDGRAGEVGRAGAPGSSGAEGITVGVPATKESFDARLQSGQNFMLDERIGGIENRLRNS